MKSIEIKRQSRLKRRRRVRKKVVGSKERPRLSVFKSARHIYAQIIDDEKGNTLVSASSLSPQLDRGEGINKRAVAGAVGKMIAEAAMRAEVKQVVFDRGGYRYHGRIKALADSARESGLEF